jgi:hypothetical protein
VRAPAPAPPPAPAAASTKKRRSDRDTAAQSSDEEHPNKGMVGTELVRMPVLDMRVKPVSTSSSSSTSASSSTALVTLGRQEGISLSQESELSLHGTCRFGIIEKPIYQKKYRGSGGQLQQ